MNVLKPLLAAALVGAIAGAVGVAGRPALAASPWGDASAAQKPPVSAFGAATAFSCTVQPVLHQNPGQPTERVPGEYIVTFTNNSSAVSPSEVVTAQLCSPGSCIKPLTFPLTPINPGATGGYTIGASNGQKGGSSTQNPNAIPVEVTICTVTSVAPAPAP
jgi:hypothetical protein